MICPNCQRRVDPITSKHWLDAATVTPDNPTADFVLKRFMAALLLWDQSAMWCHYPDRAKALGITGTDIGDNLAAALATQGQSILPTELRDLMFRVCNNLGILYGDQPEIGVVYSHGGRPKRIVLRETGGPVTNELRRAYGADH